MTIEKIKESIEKEKKIAAEITNLSQEFMNSNNEEERRVISSQINLLKESLKKAGDEVISSTEDISVVRPLLQVPTYVPKAVMVPATPPPVVKKEVPKIQEPIKKVSNKPTHLEKMTLKRMKNRNVKVVKVKEKKPSVYVKMSSSVFGNYSSSLIKRGKFGMLERDLIRANMEFVPVNYISVMFFSTFLFFFVGIVVTGFFLFFNVVVNPPFIVATKTSIGPRFLEVFWIIFALPLLTYLFTYFYPTMERKSIETRINQELPFATIHMSSISSSMIEPSKIFSIVIDTKEYPFLEREFTKLLNEVNIYGYDLVTALRDRAFNSPSRKLADLYNGVATTITSGGDLPEFFNKRSETLLFEHGIETEKHSKAAETFMDVYISVVIAAPMILMLLLVMMSASGLGLSLSTGMITLIMVLSVTIMNVIFLAFLHFKQSGTE